jgi:hypothetical protein
MSDYAIANVGTLDDAVDQLDHIVDSTNEWEPSDHVINALVEEFLALNASSYGDIREFDEPPSDRTPRCLWDMKVSYDLHDRIPSDDVGQLLDRALVSSYETSLKTQVEDADPVFYWIWCEILDRSFPHIVYVADCVAEEIAEDAPTHCRDEERISNSLVDRMTIGPDPDQYLNAEYDVDIVIDVGDADSEYTINAIDVGPDGDKEVDPKSAILWLAKTQGYTKEQLEANLFAERAVDSRTRREPEFLNSLWDELNEDPSGGAAVTFAVRMKLGQLIDLYELMRLDRPGFVHVGKRAGCGLVDFWNGGGGPFEIELEKDVDIPVQAIRCALPDESIARYSLAEIYGFPSSYWDAEAALVKEDE